MKKTIFVLLSVFVTTPSFAAPNSDYLKKLDACQLEAIRAVEDSFKSDGWADTTNSSKVLSERKIGIDAYRLEIQMRAWINGPYDGEKISVYTVDYTLAGLTALKCVYGNITLVKDEDIAD